MKNHKCGEIELFRFVFAVIIILRHTEHLVGERAYFPGGAFAVEFFFLVSGYLMMYSLEKVRAKPINCLGSETISFIKKKILSFYPELFLSLSLAFIIQSIAKHLHIAEMIYMAFGGIFEYLLIFHTGLAYGVLNYATWYLSSMVIAMMILYPLVRKYQDTMVKIVMPLMIVFISGFLIYCFGNFRSPSVWICFVNKGFLRAICELSLGMELYFVARRIRLLPLNKLSRMLLTIGKWLCWIALIWYMTKEKANYDAFFLLVCSVAVILAFSGQCLDAELYQKKTILFLGKFSLPLYLNHYYFADELRKLLPEPMEKAELVAIYIVVSFFAAGVIMYVSNYLRKNAVQITRMLKKMFFV